MDTKKATQNRWTIPQLMKKFGYSYRDLEPMTGLSASMLCRLFNGKRKFLTRHKTVVAKIFYLQEKNIIWPPKQYKTR
jgi:antitoxin component HigA of HigAB toxin-antitoxin module